MNIRYTEAIVLTTTLIATGIAYADLNQGYQTSRAVRESVQVSDMFVFNTDIAIQGGAILVRDLNNKVIRASISTNDLMPNGAYSIWWAVFNFPEYCADPANCRVSDLEVFGGDPRVQASVFWGGGFVADALGHGEANIVLTPGTTERELFGRTQNFGLKNFADSHIHIALRSHGMAGAAGPVSEQIGSADGACPPEGCFNAFNSIHHPAPSTSP